MFLLPQKHAKTEECARFFLQQQELDIHMIDNVNANLMIPAWHDVVSV